MRAIELRVRHTHTVAARVGTTRIVRLLLCAIALAATCARARRRARDIIDGRAARRHALVRGHERARVVGRHVRAAACEQQRATARLRPALGQRLKGRAQATHRLLLVERVTRARRVQAALARAVAGGRLALGARRRKARFARQAQALERLAETLAIDVAKAWTRGRGGTHALVGVDDFARSEAGAALGARIAGTLEFRARHAAVAARFLAFALVARAHDTPVCRRTRHLEWLTRAAENVAFGTWRARKVRGRWRRRHGRRFGRWCGRRLGRRLRRRFRTGRGRRLVGHDHNLALERLGRRFGPAATIAVAVVVARHRLGTGAVARRRSFARLGKDARAVRRAIERRVGRAHERVARHAARALAAAVGIARAALE
jgi:hypothetical protein